MEPVPLIVAEVPGTRLDTRERRNLTPEMALFHWSGMMAMAAEKGWPIEKLKAQVIYYGQN